MFTIPEQLSAASKANLSAQLAMFNALSGTTLEYFEKVVGLNLNTAKASLEETNAAAKQLFSVKDPQEWLSLTAALAQPNAEKALAYSRQIAGIASAAQAEFAKATEAQVAETSRKLLELVDELAKAAPAGSENAFAFFKTALGNTSAGYEQFSKTAKEAVETLETTLTTAANQFAQNVDGKPNARAAKK